MGEQDQPDTNHQEDLCPTGEDQNEARAQPNIPIPPRASTQGGTPTNTKLSAQVAAGEPGSNKQGETDPKTSNQGETPPNFKLSAQVAEGGPGGSKQEEINPEEANQASSEVPSMVEEEKKEDQAHASLGQQTPLRRLAPGKRRALQQPLPRNLQDHTVAALRKTGQERINCKEA